MAKLTRVTGKVFGSAAQAQSGGIGQFGSAATGTPNPTTDIATIQALQAYLDGWGSAVVTSRNFPPIEEVTGVLKTISYQACYTLQEGIPEYDINTEYSNTSLVKSVNNGIVTIYTSLANNNIGNSLSDGSKWKPYVLDKIQRNIGEIVQSTIPLTDAGLHLLDGSLLSGSGSYASFVTYIANLYTASPTANYFCTEAEWQQSYTYYGMCGKFVYDSTNNTVRLPKITGFVEGASGVSSLGDLTEAGLPDHTHFTVFGGQAETTYSLTTENSIAVGGVGGSTDYKYTLQGSWDNAPANIGKTSNASSSIYGNSSTVQPQSVKVLYYIVIASSAKTDIQVDIDEIAADLNGKADVDLSNCTKPHIVETYVNGTAWYNVYSNGWCEQGGRGNTANNVITISLLKSYKDINYCVTAGNNTNDAFASSTACNIISNSQFQLRCNSFAEWMWRACGYIR